MSCLEKVIFFKCPALEIVWISLSVSYNLLQIKLWKQNVLPNAVNIIEIIGVCISVGEEYVEEIKSDVGKIIGFKCTLCDCRFNDMVARSAHIKGRRHRVSYKVTKFSSTV